MSKGQVGLGVIISLGALAVAIAGGWIAQNNITDGKITAVRIESENKVEIIQKDLTKIKINTFYICQSLRLKCQE